MTAASTQTTQVPPLLERRPDGSASLNLHPGQRRAWDSTARFVVVLAGHQSGKTAFGPHWLAREIQRCGPGDYYAVTATYDLFKVKMLPELQALFSPSIGWHYAAGDQVLEHAASHTRILLRSASSLGGLEAGTALAAWLDECGQDSFKREAWEAIQRRLAIHRGRVLFTTTLYNFGWLKNDVYDRWESGNPKYDVIQFSSIENPVYSREEYERQRDTLPLWKFEMTCNGNYSRPAGLIYSDYIDSYAHQLPEGPIDPIQDLIRAADPSTAGHLVKFFTPPSAWARIVGIDFGGTEHTALVWLAEDPTRSIYYAFRETIGGGRTGQEHARDALAYTGRTLRDHSYSPQLGHVVGPTTQQGPGETVRIWAGGARSENDARLEWNMVGVPVVMPFIADVEAGIDQVISLFKQRRLFVMDTLTLLRQELRTYSRELDDAGNPTTKIDNKSKYHHLDCLRAAGACIPIGSPFPQEDLPQAPPQPRADFLDALDDKEDGRSKIAAGMAEADEAGARWTLPRWRG